MSKLKKLFAAWVACVIGIALTACGGGLTLALPGGVQSPSITSQPANQSVIAGQRATFSVAAIGNATLTYQWKKNGINIAGATSNTYTTPAASSDDHGTRYSVSVSNSSGTVTSMDASVTVFAAPSSLPAPIQPPTITTQLASQSVVAGQSATFTVKAVGGGTLAYQWKKNGTSMDGATSSSYSTPATSFADNGAQFSVVVSNSAGSVTSFDARLTVTANISAPTITRQPLAQTVTADQTATFSVAATGTAPLIYQWKKNGTDIPGATSSSYSTPAMGIAGSSAAYSVVVSNSAGIASSGSATLTVTANAMAPSITQPAAQKVTEGQSATFLVTATGTSLSYQWRKNGTDIPGATSSSYTTTATSMADSGTVFTVVVSNSAGTVTSNSATLTVSSARYSLVANASGGFYDKTECVKDNSTGLVWEGKNPDGNSTFTNYDSTTTAQKWNGSFYVNPITSDIGAITNSIGYRNSVRTSALCGFTDWRIPTKDELQGILSGGTSPTIDTEWFPNTSAVGYWSSSPYVGYASFAWGVSFYDAYPSGYNRGYFYDVRLVR